MNGHLSYVSAAVLWTLSVALGIAGTVLPDLRLMFWSLIVGLAASVVSAHMIMCSVVRAERLSIERLVDGMLARASERADRADTELRSVR